MTKTTTEAAVPEALFTRLLDAPPELVFAVWTQREHVAHWMHPKGFARVDCEALDLQPGGQLTFRMQLDEGGIIYSRSVYHEIESPRRLVYDEVCDLEGKVFHRARMTVSFLPQNGKTLVSIHGRFEWPPEFDMGWTFADMCRGWDTGWGDNMALFEAHLARLVAAGAPPEQGAFVLTRHFKAPRALVFKAFTDAGHLARWWGPKELTLRHCTLDLRPGGLFHYCMATPDGKEMWGRFLYREIVVPERVVFLNAFSDAAGNATRMPWNPSWPLQVLNTWTFTESEGGTTLHLHGVPYEATEEEWAIFSGHVDSMRQGFGGTLEQLEAYLNTVPTAG